MTRFNIVQATQQIQIIFDSNVLAEKLSNILMAQKNRSASQVANRFNYDCDVNANTVMINGDARDIIHVLNNIATAQFQREEERLISSELVNDIRTSCLQLGLLANRDRLFNNPAQVGPEEITTDRPAPSNS